MNNLPELITYKIWKYYWKNKKQNYLQDIKNKKHKLYYLSVEYIYLDNDERYRYSNLNFNHPINELLWMSQ